MIKLRPLPLVSALSAVLLLSACAPVADSPKSEDKLVISLHENEVPDDGAEPVQVARQTADVRTDSPQSVAPVLAKEEGRMEGSAGAVYDRTQSARPMSPPMPAKSVASYQPPSGPAEPVPYSQPTDTERYADLQANPVVAVANTPVSTFSVDVDTGAYSNVRRFIEQGQLPPTDAVRVEEFVNYFDYSYPTPSSRSQPFTVSTELALTPWNAERWLLQVGLKGFEVPRSQLPASNLVFLLDVSGSMQSPDKLPLVKSAMRMLVEQLRPQDRVAIVVYAGAAGLVLPSTPGSSKNDILGALDGLEAGGSTNGGEGIRLAYQIARQNFVEDGVNRVILATDGDFNVGTVNQQQLEDLVSRERKSGVALTTLGFGQGNYNDHLAERLADLGDGNHAYIDTEKEARKVLVEELSANLLTIAKDVKIQIEFNPAVIAEYRLIGYENRLLAREDFDNDAVDAGEIGAGHTVTALYELTPVGSAANRLPPLRYSDKAATQGSAEEVAFLKLRYKQPDQEQSQLIEKPIPVPTRLGSGSPEIQFSAAVAAFGEALRGGKYLDGYGYTAIAELAQAHQGADPYGLRAELVQLIQRAGELADPNDSNAVAVAR